MGFNQSIENTFESLQQWVNVTPNIRQRQYAPGDVVMGLPARFWYSELDLLSPQPVAQALHAFANASKLSQPIFAFNSEQDPLVTPNIWRTLHQILYYIDKAKTAVVPNITHFMTPGDLSSGTVVDA